MLGIYRGNAFRAGSYNRTMNAKAPGNAQAPGLAAAVQPAATTQVVTDAQGLTEGDVRIPAPAGELRVYRAMPESGANLPIIVVVQEIFGLHEHIRDVARRFAKLGYLAVAPDLYARQGDVTKLASIDEIRPIVGSVPDAQVMADIDAAVAWAARNGGDAARLAITGFCWGGRIVWLYAAHNPKVKAGVAWYGKVESPATPLQPRSPLDLAAAIDPPVLGLYGGADAGIPNEGVERMRQALRAAGKPSEIHTYPDMPHAFFADYRPSYRREAAQDGWQRALSWLRRHGAC
jgi:carboxymethylenebutenolidase